ncbi:alpha-methyldopa hypersensitive protein-like [Agrilus planipennis]|nr:alpha-methyldopa hypersensitive protein-like [Agrilus planipennis]
MTDIERVIMPGITHWNSPHFHAYYPTACSFPSIVGEILSAGLSSIGFSWISSPACTELEVVMMNWLGNLLGLPETFLNSSSGPGGGTIQGSASEATLVGLLSAREKTVKELRENDPSLSESDIRGRLVAYTSDQANSSVEKAGLLGAVPMKHVPADENGCLRGEALQKAIDEDKRNNRIPFYVVATLGSTGTCAFDKLEEIGPICKKEGVWLHIDAAYAGTAFVCPEYRPLMKGVHYADSFNYNPHKWMLVNFDCSAMWFQNVKHLVESFNVDRIYLKHQHEGHAPDYRHWQIALGRRFRSLKLWFTLRIYGVEGIRNHVRSQIALAKYFEELVSGDSRFEVLTSNLGLVCFRLKGDDKLTKDLLQKITEKKKLYLISCYYRNKFVIRFVICSRLTNSSDVEFAWKEISGIANEIIPRKFFENVKMPSISSIADSCKNNGIVGLNDAFSKGAA